MSELVFDFITKPNVRIVSEEQKRKLQASRVSVPLTFTATKSGSGFTVGGKFFDANEMLKNEFKMAKANGDAYVFVVGEGLGTSLKKSDRSETGGKSKRFGANNFEVMLVELGLLPAPIADKTVYTEKKEPIYTFEIGTKAVLDLVKVDIEYPGASAVYKVVPFDMEAAKAELEEKLANGENIDGDGDDNDGDDAAMDSQIPAAVSAESPAGADVDEDED